MTADPQEPPHTAPGPASLHEALAGAATVPAAAEAVMEHCLAAGYALPSLYLERGDRLRCIAHRGYWQVYDGLPAGAGVAGITYADGLPHVITDVDEFPDYIRAVPEVRAEICLPLRHDGRVVGIVNVESTATFTDEDVERVRGVTAAFEQALERLGGPAPESPAELLARLGHELVRRSDPEQIALAALDAARRISGLASAALVTSADGALTVRCATGPHAGLLRGLGRETLRQLGDHVALATSSYATGLAPGGGVEATHLLRERGVASIAVLALGSEGSRAGLLVLTGDRPAPQLASRVPLLELLAATTEATLAAASANVALRRSEQELAHRARHDTLTGVANRSHLLAEIEQELAGPEPSRDGIVLFVDLDGFKRVNDEHGHRVGDLLLAGVAGRLRRAARDTDLVARIGGDEFVVVCRGIGSLDQAAVVARRIVARIAEPFRVDDVTATVTASIGLAPLRGATSAEQVVAEADRAMYLAKREGGAVATLPATRAPDRG
jgi:diguanylate cyclase (GGDEF)-like protein